MFTSARLLASVLVVLVCAVRTAGAAQVEQWARSYVGIGSSAAYSLDSFQAIAPTADGGYIVAGSTTSYGAGAYDSWVLRLDAAGSIVRQKTYGVSAGAFEGFNAIQPTADGGYILAGFTQVPSSGQDYGNALVLKIDGAGDITWQKVYGQLSRASAIRVTADGGYIVAGNASSSGAGSDSWVLKLDTGGNIVWQKTYGGANDDVAYSVRRLQTMVTSWLAGRVPWCWQR